MDRETGKRMAGGRAPKQKKPKRRSRLNRQQKALVAVAAVLAVALTVVLAWRSVFVKPDLPTEKNPGDAQTEPIDYGEGVRPKAGGERKSKDWYTVLILGRDTGGGGNTDTMLLASYDVTNQKASVMSIPRDTMVNVSWDVKKINSVYNVNGGGEKGIQALYKEIAQLVGFEPDYQVVVEWEAVGKIVDAIGGVWFDVPRDMNYEDPYQDLSIHQKKGYRLLTGDDAMQVIRYRHDNRKNGVTKGYLDGDLGRIKTQQAFLMATVDQLLKLENITKVNKIAKVFQECVETDLSFQNILWFGQSAYVGGLKTENVSFFTMPNKSANVYSPSVSRQVGQNNYQNYVVPLSSALLDLVNVQLSPFVEPFTLRDLDIMSVNGDGSISSTTGHVEDSQAAKPPVLLFNDEPEPPEEGEVLIDPETGWPIDPVTGLPVDPSTLPPTDPVVPPIDPVTPPTNPVTPPTNPVTPPIDPVVPPTDPVTPPTDPVVPPTDPVTPPTDPVTPPTDPVVPDSPDFIIIEPPPAI